MLFKAIYWCWVHTVALFLRQFGTRGERIHAELFEAFIKPVGMTLAFIAYLFYPPIVIDGPREPGEDSSG